MSSNFIVDIKKAIVLALQAAFGDVDYPDDIQNINISMEYPLVQEQYPHLWVQFSLSTIENSGIGHITWEDNTIHHELMFSGIVTLSIIALTSKSRDIYASQLVQMLMFRDLSPVAAQFDEYIRNDSRVHISFNKGDLQLSGQQVTVGTPWSDTQLTYEDGYSFKVVGQVTSTFSTTPAVLKKIVVNAENQFGGSAQYEVTTNNVLPGEWV